MQVTEVEKDVADSGAHSVTAESLTGDVVNSEPAAAAFDIQVVGAICNSCSTLAAFILELMPGDMDGGGGGGGGRGESFFILLS